MGGAASRNKIQTDKSNTEKRPKRTERIDVPLHDNGVETDKTECIPLTEPWRIIDQAKEWDTEYCEGIIEDIRTEKRKTDEHGEHIDPESFTILLIGPESAGKSSFINSVASIDIGRIVGGREVAGQLTASVTENLSQFIPKVKLRRFRILDTPGIALSTGLNETDLKYIMKGNIKPGYKFQEKSITENGNAFFNAKPSLADAVHCVVLVIDSMTIDGFNDEFSRKIQDVQFAIKGNAIGTVLLLTKIDDVCCHHEQDMENVFKCKAIKKIVNDAARNFGVPENNIFPVKNYSKELEMGTKTNVLILMALRKMIQMSSDHIDHLMDQTLKEPKQRYDARNNES